MDKAFFGMSDGRETFFIDRNGVVRGSCRKNLQFRLVIHVACADEEELIPLSAHVDFIEEMLKKVEAEDKA